MVNETPLDESEHGLDMRWSHEAETFFAMLGMQIRCFDEVADRYDAALPEDTQDGSIAYARVERSRLRRYVDGLLPSDGGATVKRP